MFCSYRNLLKLLAFNFHAAHRCKLLGIEIVNSQKAWNAFEGGAFSLLSKKDLLAILILRKPCFQSSWINAGYLYYFLIPTKVGSTNIPTYFSSLEIDLQMSNASTKRSKEKLLKLHFCWREVFLCLDVRPFDSTCVLAKTLY